MVGHDEDNNDELRACEFPRIAGGKPFDIDEPWFGEERTITLRIEEEQLKERCAELHLRGWNTTPQAKQF